MGSNAPHALGSVGPQYVIWTAGGKDELSRSEQALKARSAHTETRVCEGSRSWRGVTRTASR